MSISSLHAASVNLAWTAPSTGGPVEGYVLYGKIAGGDYSNPDIWEVVGGTSVTIDGFDLTEDIICYFIVKAYNSAGFGPASNELPVDFPPVPPVVSSSTALTNSTTLTWTWTASGGGNGTFRYKLDSSDLSTGATQTTALTYTSGTLSDGTHTLYVQERDAAGNWSDSGSFAVVVDTIPPNPPVVSGATPTNDSTPTWTWASGGGEGNGTYRYKLDSSDMSTGATQTTALTYTSGSLLDGPHTLYVQERDVAGNWSNSGSFTVVIDTVPPNAPVVSGTTPTNDTTPTWTWASGGGGGNGTYRYKLDSSDLSTGATQTTALTYTSGALSDGTHTLYVQERDAAGNWSNSGSFAIVIDTTPPNAPVVSGTTPTNDTTPTWTWVSGGGGGNGTYRYKLDSSDLSTGATETTATTYTASTEFLDASTHTLYVQERDAVGNWSSSGTRAIVVDTTPPTSSAIAPSYGNAALNITWTASDVSGSGVASTQLWYKKGSGGTWANTGLAAQTATSGTFTYTPTGGDDTYYFATKATDNAGNIEADPTGDGDDSTIFDTTLPESDGIADITYSPTQSGLQINGSNTTDISSIRLYRNNILVHEIPTTGTSWSYTYTGTAEFGDIFELRAVDAAGNESSPGELTYTYEFGGPFNILTKTLQNGVVGQAYSVTLEVDAEEITWALVSGALPDGLTRDMGLIAGSPTSEGSYTFTISGTNIDDESITQEYTLTIDPSGTTDLTVMDAIQGTYVIVSSNSGNIVNLQGQAPSYLESPPEDAEFPYGVFKFQITGLAAGGSATLTFDFEEDISSDAAWYWYNAEAGTWTDISDDVNMTVNGIRVQITVTDGGAGDSDAVSGQITDPSGPALLPSSEVLYTAVGGGDSGCFIATAAYGSAFERHVEILRQFRDVYLMKIWFGRGFVDLYYKYSPALAGYIAEHNFLRAAVRWGLAPVVGAAYVALNTTAAQKAELIGLLGLLGFIGLLGLHQREG